MRAKIFRSIFAAALLIGLQFWPACGVEFPQPTPTPHPAPIPQPSPGPQPTAPEFSYSTWANYGLLPPQIQAQVLTALNECFPGEGSLTLSTVPGEIYLATVRQGGMPSFASMVSFLTNWRLPDTLGRGDTIANVCTATAWRGKGLATQLLNRVIADFRTKRPGVKNLYLTVREDNTAARSLYQKLGFVQIGQVVDATRPGVPLLTMVLRFP